MGEVAEAVTHLTKALQLSPESEPTKYMLALAYKKMNQIKNSAELFS
jgi:Tfp pilus assembly protein PilF